MKNKQTLAKLRYAIFAALAFTGVALCPSPAYADGVADSKTITSVVSALPHQLKDGATYPSGLFVTEKFLFVLEQSEHRIAVYNRDSELGDDPVFYYGSNGKGDGQFNKPRGIAASPVENYFAVADTGNNRIQVFSYDADTGAITHVLSYGTKGMGGVEEAADKFNGPRAVAFTADGGELLVADGGNFRVTRYWFDGGAVGGIVTPNEKSGSYALSTASGYVPDGLCCDVRDGVKGFWAAIGNKGVVAFYPFSVTDGTPSKTLTDSFFEYPSDVQIWRQGERKSICVVDNNICCVKAFTDEGLYLGMIGKFQDPVLQSYDWLQLPYAVVPVANTDTIYVADQGNLNAGRVVWFNGELPPPPVASFITLSTDADTLTEGGAEGTVCVSLSRPPESEVTILLSSEETQAFRFDGDATLTFAAGATEPQTVKILPLDGPKTFQITAQDVSATAVYELEEAISITVENRAPAIASPVDGWEAAAGIEGAAYTVEWAATDVDADISKLEARVDFGDGSGPTDWIKDASGTTDHVYAAGTYNITITVRDTEGGEAKVVSGDVVIEAATPPEPKFEEVEWRFTGIECADSTVTLTWDVDSCISGGGQDGTFSIGHKAELSDEKWDRETIPAVTVTKGSASGTTTLSLEEYSLSPSIGFFRIWWTNKPASGGD